MTISGRGVLIVGLSIGSAQALAARLRKWGFRCHRAGTFREARELLEWVHVGLMLTNTRLPDGTGSGLALSLSGLAITVFICVPIEDSCLWLPAIDHGRICLGLPALRPSEFAKLLKEAAAELLAEGNSTSVQLIKQSL